MWYNIGMIINTVIQTEVERNEAMIRDYEALIKELPKGSLICRKNRYYYLKYRKDGKIIDEYIGKDEEKVARIRELLALRQHYIIMLSELLKEQKTINKILDTLE